MQSVGRVDRESERSMKRGCVTSILIYTVPLGGQDVDISVSDFFFHRPIVVINLLSILGNPDTSHPLMQLLLRVHAQVPDVLG